jgi:uncharacterized membrane protein YdcZ (DUF606 family)
MAMVEVLKGDFDRIPAAVLMLRLGRALNAFLVPAAVAIGVGAVVLRLVTVLWIRIAVQCRQYTVKAKERRQAWRAGVLALVAATLHISGRHVRVAETRPSAPVAVVAWLMPQMGGGGEKTGAISGSRGRDFKAVADGVLV